MSDADPAAPAPTPEPFAAPAARARMAPPTDPVPDNGYRWWYLDGTSDDGRHALTAIVFIGSVFSPWYRFARRGGRRAAALEHAAVNLALYGPVERWCMTERGAGAVRATRDALAIGPTTMHQGETTLRLDIDERGAPFPRRLRGTIEVDATPAPVVPARHLDAAGHHEWQPIAPQTRIRVRMAEPALSWEGIAYVDTNRGSVPLEDSFATWHWSRAHAADGATLVRYDVVERDGAASSRTLEIDASGRIEERDPGVSHALPPTRWFGMARPTRLRAGARFEGLQTLENAPFYSRSRGIERVGEARHSAVHESLDMDRFVHPLVQCLLPVRTPRVPGRAAGGRGAAGPVPEPGAE